MTSPTSVTLSPRSGSGGNTPRSGSGFNSIFSKEGSVNHPKKWNNCQVKSPKLTSHNFPDNLPTELISHFYSTNDEKLYKTSSMIDSISTPSNKNTTKLKFNSKIETNKLFKHAKVCSKNGHMSETDDRFKSDI